MSTILIKIATHSEIIACGLLSVISSACHQKTRVQIVSPDFPDSLLEQSKGNELIVADATLFSPEALSTLRNSNKKRPVVIGLYISALPASISRHFDHLISVYSDEKHIHQVISKALSDLEMTDQSTTEELTPREKEIVIGVVKGKSNKEIATQLNVSVHTVTTHRRNIAAKLQIHSPAALTIYAIVSKLVAIDEIKSELL